MANKISIAEQKLQNLKAYRATNIQNMLNEWVTEDYIDMKKAYTIAKELAEERADDFSIKLNEEKLSQVEEAWILKQKTIQQPVLTEKRPNTPISEATL